MPDVPLVLTVKQLVKVKASLRKRAGADDERSDAQLLRASIIDHLSGLVRYDAEQVAKANIEEF